MRGRRCRIHNLQLWRTGERGYARPDPVPSGRGWRGRTNGHCTARRTNLNGSPLGWGRHGQAGGRSADRASGTKPPTRNVELQQLTAKRRGGEYSPPHYCSRLSSNQHRYFFCPYLFLPIHPKVVNPVKFVWIGSKFQEEGQHASSVEYLTQRIGAKSS